MAGHVLAPTVSAAIRPTPAALSAPGYGGAGSRAVIPEPSDQIAHRKRRGSRGGRPPAFDAQDYKGRNVVERNFNTVKQWRGLATRYDKLAIVYRGAAVLRAITLWLPHLSDTP